EMIADAISIGSCSWRLRTSTAHSRESGNPELRTGRKEPGPRFAGRPIARLRDGDAPERRARTEQAFCALGRGAPRAHCSIHRNDVAALVVHHDVVVGA